MTVLIASTESYVLNLEPLKMNLFYFEILNIHIEICQTSWAILLHKLRGLFIKKQTRTTTICTHNIVTVLIYGLLGSSTWTSLIEENAYSVLFFSFVSLQVNLK